ncbi:HMG1/2-like protein isoform X1 [Impatiens glandulifera]|uniref:HMG1/2-like protein isoform X1 n=2 Tax=Impatiens glandulifera TaxID=253017 RepID=UPI001FB06F80|nr:HMG1/2-like protein isoform X1 [Impatiens glandulifera]
MKGGKSKTEAKKPDSRLSVKKGKGGGGTAKAAPKRPVKGAAKDPNKPKRPPSAFFVFMEDFRKQYKEKHPNNKSVAAVGKAAGDKWKSLSDAEKAPYISKAEKRKVDYNKSMDAYNKKLAGGTGEEDESDKSKSEVNDEDEDQSGEDDEDDEEEDD